MYKEPVTKEKGAKNVMKTAVLKLQILQTPIVY